MSVRGLLLILLVDTAPAGSPSGSVVSPAAPLSLTVGVPLIKRRGRDSSRGSAISHLGTTIRGSASDDYAAPFTIDGQTFHLNVDTGSPTLAVAGRRELGCNAWLNTSHGCGEDVHLEYGSCWWKGVECLRDVHIGGLKVEGYAMAAIHNENALLTCPGTPDSSPNSQSHMLRRDAVVEGIIGLDFNTDTPVTKNEEPFMYKLFAAHPHLPRSFSFQCCAYDALTQTGGTGALDVGLPDPTHYTGRPEYASVVEAVFWGVDLKGVSVGGEDVLRDSGVDKNGLNNTAVDNNGHAKYIVDSGTSSLVFLRPTYEAIIEKVCIARPIQRAVLRE